MSAANGVMLLLALVGMAFSFAGGWLINDVPVLDVTLIALGGVVTFTGLSDIQ